MIMVLRLIAATAVAAACFAAPAQAAQLHYAATLNGVQYPTETGSPATGAATFDIDTDAQTIDAHIAITGLKFADLSQHLAHSRMGPMHLHRYQGDDVTLILPFPFGASYAETADGFTVDIDNYPYADGAERTGSHLSFEQFLAALANDPIYLNIHTQAFGDGEISGRVAPAA
jgi:hypothetical protein